MECSKSDLATKNILLPKKTFVFKKQQMVKQFIIIYIHYISEDLQKQEILNLQLWIEKNEVLILILS